jgi:hypothetical protein
MAHARPIKMTFVDILCENALQIVLYILGAILAGLLWWPLAPLYLAACVLSNVLYMAWVCPYCGHYLRGTCPAGFDILSGRRFKAELGKTFAGQFRKNVYVMVPGWVVPPIVGIILLVGQFSWLVLGLVILFCFIGFWWLPEASKSHCEGCETVDCPRRPKR